MERKEKAAGNQSVQLHSTIATTDYLICSAVPNVQVIVVGTNHHCRRSLTRALQQCNDCTTAVLDLGNLALFRCFLEAFDEVAYAHYVIAWDVSRGENLLDMADYLRVISHMLRQQTSKSGQYLEVVIAAVFDTDQPDQQQLVDEQVENASDLTNFRYVRPRVSNSLSFTFFLSFSPSPSLCLSVCLYRNK